MTGGGFAPLVLLGRCSDERAELLVVDRGPAGAAPGVRIEGRLTGPRCSRGTMLPVDVVLEPLPPVPGGVALARCILTEPAYWQPDVPALYRLEARLIGDGGTATAAVTVGLRRGGVRARSLWLEGRRYVPRGVSCPALTAGLADELRAAAAAAWITDPDERSLALAASAGVAVVARLSAAGGGDVAARLVDLATCPAVLLAVVAAGVPAAAVAAGLAGAGKRRGSLPVGWEVDGTRPPSAATLPPVDALVALLPGGADPAPGWRESPPVALVAAATMPHPLTPVAVARRECDRLQARLAAWGSGAGTGATVPWAGYLVG
ncbi:MAG: hypothetical protein ACKO9B_12225 [Planctomycetota bacterium]